MFCGNCGKEKGNSRFCPYCGFEDKSITASETTPEAAPAAPVAPDAIAPVAPVATAPVEPVPVAPAPAAPVAPVAPAAPVNDTPRKKSKLWLIILLILILIGVGVGAFFYFRQKAKSDELDEHLNLAKQYVDELDYEQAIAELKLAIEIDPKCEDAYLELADIYVSLGDYDEGIACLKKGYKNTEAKRIKKELESVQEEAEKQPTGNVIPTPTPVPDPDPEPNPNPPVNMVDPGPVTDSYIGKRPVLTGDAAFSEGMDVRPNAEQFQVDFNQIDNLWQYWISDDAKSVIQQNGFTVGYNAGDEFFEIYETNRYSERANFVTVDSMMHTYHLYFSYLMKNIEKQHLAEDVNQLSKNMLANCMKQYEELKGTDWEKGAYRNVVFFSVGCMLMDSGTVVPDYAMNDVNLELQKIAQAEGIGVSVITEDYEDYSQYKVRGYYEGDPLLEKYFKTMMWYGRIHFKASDNDALKASALMTEAIATDYNSYHLWEAIYSVTAFFAGASDDLGICEYGPVIDNIYGRGADIKKFLDDDKFTEYKVAIGNMPLPEINSIPIDDGENNVILGFRFMGQRFTIDAMVMQNLIYSRVKTNSRGETRMLPDVLDVMAALGSEVAMDLLENMGATDYDGYSSNMNMLRKAIDKADDSVWTASLYASWLNTLRPLLDRDHRKNGYPGFMQNEEWDKKNLETFAGSYSELKHDTILYAKQVMAEMGGGDEETPIPDDRGYVEPEPLVYERFAILTDATAEGLRKFGYLSSSDAENLARLSQLSQALKTISEKELTNQLPSDEEFEIIRSYGGTLEHFWYEVMSAEHPGERIYTEDYPAAIVVDVATDPNAGQVLELATGKPSMIYVVVKVDGKMKICSGSVYSFYQFTQPMDQRMTDSDWRLLMGYQCDENYNYNWGFDDSGIKPDWCKSYRFNYGN